MPEVLANFPLANLQTDSLSELEQEVALIAAESCFVPTEIAVKIAYTMQRMLLKGYIYRNPYLSDNKRFINKLAKNPESMLASLSKRSRKPVSATILKGITNLGKTHIYSRFLDILPAQVIEHDTNEKAGWAYQKQLNWLIVDMSHDGSRSGLLDNLFSAIDCVLKTTYFNDYFGKRISISSKASQAVVALTTHYCGMVVIEELQKRNFEDKCFRQELVLLFLHLLNVGIP
jgi:hypothetical protein